MFKRLRAGTLGVVLVAALGLGACQPGPSSPTSAEDAIRQQFGAIADQAMRVAQCESGMDPSAVSPGGGNWGLFQINTVHAGEFESVTGRPFYNDSLDAWANTAYAVRLYNEAGGWGPWSCRWAA